MSGQQAPGPTAPSRGAGWRDRLTTTRVLVLVLVVLAVVLIAENTQHVKIRLIVPVVTMPLYAALLIMFVLGLLSGALLLYGRRRRKRRRQL
ncbi:lipopolysaccharide assembly protein LapA domain-containing protein [Streptomyces sp. V4-01]|uniref:Lipopolysaccharide assembly protein LapA domain-containing protein n=1 Tax=Actinacidiphila polyblastidii TaxID=3110430 RepID=A0ABU7P487_9ACTN|nr:lipopolysaccharide assembly protein LapA domain-containing protein [Streptomyces sp. V4-01]